MKLIIQIPCFNEEKTLKSVLEELPKKIDWIDIIQTMIIDDGSSDNTIKVAKDFWVNHIIIHVWNKGLWNAFRSGMEKALLENADILVNTDWDNQYPWKYIWDLVQPIIDKNRYIVDFANHVWEIDIFYGDNEGLVIAEVELEDENEHIELPLWIKEEVTGDIKYYNSNLMSYPYNKWK